MPFDLRATYRGMTLPIAGAVLSAAILTSAGSRAAEPKSGTNRVAPDAKQPAQKSPSSDAVSQLGLAYGLVKYGREQKSPLALLTAAEILHRTPTGELAAKRSTEAGPKSADATPEKKQRPDVTVAGLIAEAKQLAAADQQVMAIAAKLAETTDEASRGAVLGPQSKATEVNAMTTDVYNLNFRGGEPATIVVSGDHDTDLDLYVYDELGNLIASDDDGTDQCIVRFTPRWTGPFVVRVKNRGLVYNRYVIATN